MSRGNEIPMDMMNNAHLLGQQQRMPTDAERKQMEREAITMAVLQVSGTALSSMIESGKRALAPESVGVALSVAKDILSQSEETSSDYGDNVPKRKLRNQLAAQLIYSALRGGIMYSNEVTRVSFETATKLLEEAEKYGEEEVEKSTPTPSPIVT